MVQPMMEISGEHADRWGVWDEEKYDKKVEYMLRLLGEDHSFGKSNWGGGDHGETIFVFEEGGQKKKRKAEDVDGSDTEPALKQRRMSEYFKREAVMAGKKQAEVESQLGEVCQEVCRLKAVILKQGKRLERLENILKGRSGTKRTKSKRRKVKKVPVSDEINADDEEGLNEERSRNDQSTGEQEDTPLRARLSKDGGVSSNWIEGGKSGGGDMVLYQGVASGTYFVMENEEEDGGGLNEEGMNREVR